MSELDDKLSALIADFGSHQVSESLAQLRQANSAHDTCTIIVNEGMHKIPEHIIQGELYTVYSGSLDFSTSDSIRNEMLRLLKPLRSFLMSKKWSHIFIVITGHPVVCMTVKMAIYRICRIDSIDWIFTDGRYVPLELNMREALLKPIERL